jgi:hypothetical protein
MGATHEISRPHYRKEYHKPAVEAAAPAEDATKTAEAAVENTEAENTEAEKAVAEVNAEEAIPAKTDEE